MENATGSFWTSNNSVRATSLKLDSQSLAKSLGSPQPEVRGLGAVAPALFYRYVVLKAYISHQNAQVFR